MNVYFTCVKKLPSYNVNEMSRTDTFLPSQKFPLSEQRHIKSCVHIFLLFLKTALQWGFIPSIAANVPGIRTSEAKTLLNENILFAGRASTFPREEIVKGILQKVDMLQEGYVQGPRRNPEEIHTSIRSFRRLVRPPTRSFCCAASIQEPYCCLQVRVYKELIPRRPRMGMCRMQSGFYKLLTTMCY